METDGSKSSTTLTSNQREEKAVTQHAGKNVVIWWGVQRHEEPEPAHCQHANTDILEKEIVLFFLQLIYDGLLKKMFPSITFVTTFSEKGH